MIKLLGLPMETGFQTFGLLKAEVNFKEAAVLLALVVLCLGRGALGGVLLSW